MNTNIQAIQETDHEQTFCERKNHLAKEAHACSTANETIEDAEQRRSVQKQTYACQYEE
ncbi:7315_t:CDS:2, partial [Gigaspora margarita]